MNIYQILTESKHFFVKFSNLHSLVLLCSLLFGCSNDTYRTFYRGNGNSMYFLQPVKYVSQSDDIVAFVDFTIEDNAETATLNVTTSSKSIFAFERVGILDRTGAYIYSKPMKFNAKKNKEYFEQRYSAKFLTDALKGFIESTTLSLQIDSVEFIPTKKTMKILTRFNSEVIF